jgi:restriction endonuclease Mrr
MLVDLMFRYNVWVQTKETYEIKYIDEDFFLWFN